MAATGQRASEDAVEKDDIVCLDGVTLRYGRGESVFTALDNVTLRIPRGQRVCVLGPNGSGKSTLASVICGLLAPDEGRVSLVGEAVLGDEGVDFEAYQRARRKVGLVFQNPDDQMVTSVVEEDVAFGPENLCLTPEQIEHRVRRELARVALSDRAHDNPANLSGGQKQRVAIAGALAMEPRVLVLDEPGALLDVRGRRGIMRVMGELHEIGCTIVHITHFMDEALEADRVLVLDRGRIVLDGSPQEVFSHGELLFSLGLDLPFAARLAQALRGRGLDLPLTCDDEELLGALARVEKDRDKSGSELARRLGQRDRASNPAGPHVRAEQVFFSHREGEERPALRDISFDIEPGSSVAIIGQTGSGKTTLVRLLCALAVPDRGRVLIGDLDSSKKKERRRLHGTIGYVMQHPERQLFAETVLEDVAFGPRNLGLSGEELSKRCSDALALVGLSGKEKASPFKLSGGQQRLCAIAGILAMDPQTIVLDEPTAGLDPRGREQVEGLLNDVHQRGVTTIRVTHSMDEAASCEHVIVLSNAELLLQGRPDEVFSPEHEALLHDAGLGLPEALRYAMRLGLEERPLTLDELVDLLAPASEGEVG